MNRRCRILICDDHAEFRDMVKTVLKRETGIEIVGEAGDGKECIEQALKLRPDVVLMDLHLPELNGLEATRRIRKATKRIKVLILSAFSGEDVVLPCRKAGASGYLQKYRSLSELSEAIQVVRRGGTYLSPSALEKVSGAHGTSLY
jgi:DNA-binding NarL/FixJ family response regulator